MTNRSLLIGAVAGAAGSAASIAGNLSRNDPHMVSAYPDGMSAVIAPVLIYMMIRILRLPKGSPAEVALGAGAVHGLALGAYTAWWLPIPAMSLLAVGVIGGFMIAFLLAWPAAWAAWRPRRRAQVL